MHIDFQTDDGTGRCSLAARSEATDRALPVAALLLDAAPLTIDPDRVAVAGAILFADHSGGELSVSQPISEAVADAVYTSMGLRVTHAVASAERGPQPASPAPPTQATTLSVDASTSLGDPTPGIDRTRLRLVPGERFQGALYGVKEAVIASNAWLLATYLDPARVHLAAGILFAHDFLARGIEIDEALGTSAAMPAGAQQLCAAVGLDLR